MRTLKFKAQTTNAFFTIVNQTVRRLLPTASDYCRERKHQIVEQSSDNETVLGGSRKLGGAAIRFIDGSEKRIYRSAF